MLVILTTPIPDNLNSLLRYLYLRFLSLFFIKHRYTGGHFAVLRSVLMGFKKNRTPFVFNPIALKSNYDIVWVPAGIDALNQAVKLKKQGLIKKILAGPNLMVWSSDYDGILANPMIDRVLLPSQWTVTAYIEDLPIIKNKITVWYAGVDETYWQPDLGVKKDLILIYNKSGDPETLRTVENLLRTNRHDYLIITYGQYNKKYYKHCLNRTLLIIFISSHESQGLALAEAWSMNVPTLCWDPGSLEFLGRSYSEVSSCPYLSDQSGLRWKDVSQLPELLAGMIRDIQDYSPRKWLLNNMTDQISARNLTSIIDKII